MSKLYRVGGQRGMAFDGFEKDPAMGDNGCYR